MKDFTREAYVISDLHIGGDYSTETSKDRPQNRRNNRGFRLFNKCDVLVEFIEMLIRRGEDGKDIELIINGDFVDFLAEKDSESNTWKPFIPEPDRAVKLLETIAHRDRTIFDALARFLEGNNALTILIGNHDIELSFPDVRRNLDEILGVKRESRFRFIHDGEAYVIGEALIEHGNGYDEFNEVDHKSLEGIRASHSRREPACRYPDFRPPSGSRLVANIMNPIKSDYLLLTCSNLKRKLSFPFFLRLNLNTGDISATF